MGTAHEVGALLGINRSDMSHMVSFYRDLISDDLALLDIPNPLPCHDELHARLFSNHRSNMWSFPEHKSSNEEEILPGDHPDPISIWEVVHIEVVRDHTVVVVAVIIVPETLNEMHPSVRFVTPERVVQDSPISDPMFNAAREPVSYELLTCSRGDQYSVPLLPPLLDLIDCTSIGGLPMLLIGSPGYRVKVIKVRFTKPFPLILMGSDGYMFSALRFVLWSGVEIDLVPTCGQQGT